MFEKSLRNSISVDILRERKGSQYNSLIEQSLGFEYPMHSLDHLTSTEPSTQFQTSGLANKENVDHQTFVHKSKLIKPRQDSRSTSANEKRDPLSKNNERTAMIATSSKSYKDDMSAKKVIKPRVSTSVNNMKTDANSATPSKFGSPPKPCSRGNSISQSAIAQSDLASLVSSPVPRKKLVESVVAKHIVVNSTNNPVVRSRVPGRPPRGKQEIEKMSIIDYGRSVVERRQSEILSRQRQSRPIPKTTTANRSFAQAHHLRKIKDLFSKLDSDKDGLISADKIDVGQVPGTQLKIICPVLFEMEEKREVLNSATFERRVMELTNKLTLFDKQSVFYPVSGKGSQLPSARHSARVDISDLGIL